MRGICYGMTTSQSNDEKLMDYWRLVLTWPFLSWKDLVGESMQIVLRNSLTFSGSRSSWIAL